MLGDQFSTPAVISDAANVVKDEENHEVDLALPDTYETTISGGEIKRLILSLILIFSMIALIAQFVH